MIEVMYVLSDLPAEEPGGPHRVAHSLEKAAEYGRERLASYVAHALGAGDPTEELLDATEFRKSREGEDWVVVFTDDNILAPVIRIREVQVIG